MTTTIEKAREELDELVTKANEGEAVIITVGGEPRAQLTAIPAQEEIGNGRADWSAELAAFAAEITTKVTGSSQQILSDQREDRH